MVEEKTQNKFNFSGAVYFYLCNEQAYEHLMINIAEGLKVLGVPFYANFNNWKTDLDSESYLFNHNSSVHHRDCSVVVLSNHWLEYHQYLPPEFFHPQRKYVTVYLDDTDGHSLFCYYLNYPVLNNFDFIFKTSCNSFDEYPAHLNPWFFGVSNRMLQLTQHFGKFEERTKSLLINYRVEHNTLLLLSCVDFSVQIPGMQELEIPGMQRTSEINDNKKIRYRVDLPLRRIANQNFHPLIKNILKLDRTIEDFTQAPTDPFHYQLWQQTGKRHHPGYYQRLTQSLACSAFGGYLAPNNDGQNFHAEWWDSWRFWESLGAGCIPFHIDFDKYGVNLPVRPENWKHYIGIDLDNIQETVDRLVEEPEILERISIAGREWAIEHYSPVPTALRFLEIVSGMVNLTTRGEIRENFATHNLPFDLTEFNLIIFPDWLQTEENIGLELQEAIKSLVTHPQKAKMTLLIDHSNISTEDAELLLSSAVMNLLMEEQLEVDEGPEVVLVSQLSPIQWSALIPQLQGRIKLEYENEEAIHLFKAQEIPIVEIQA